MRAMSQVDAVADADLVLRFKGGEESAFRSEPRLRHDPTPLEAEVNVAAALAPLTVRSRRRASTWPWSGTETSAVAAVHSQ